MIIGSSLYYSNSGTTLHVHVFVHVHVHCTCPSFKYTQATPCFNVACCGLSAWEASGQDERTLAKMEMSVQLHEVYRVPDQMWVTYAHL